MSADTSEGVQLVRALGHPLRRSILKEMQGVEEISPRELSDRMKKPLSNLSYHIRVLVKCEAIVLVKRRPVRGAIQHFYRFAIEAEWPYAVLGLTPPSLSGD
jgi:DNA-binding transcriptional ArsR family regulator